MEIRIPEDLETEIMKEVALKPGMDKRTYVLAAIRHQLSQDCGYRKRSQDKREKDKAYLESISHSDQHSYA